MLVIGLCISIISVNIINYLIYLTMGQIILCDLFVSSLFNLLFVLKLGYYLSLDARSIVFLNLLDSFKQSLKHLRGV